ncbi:MAG: SBBP repeat-containing protein [Planctomycetota bacterium]|nr:SBBP repeat-containing protein [Planctomycetota bacterium]
MRSSSARRHRSTLFVIAAFMGLSLISTCGAPTRVQSPAADDALPAGYFTQNMGQVENQDVLYYSNGGVLQVGFGEATLFLKVLQAPAAHPSYSASGGGGLGGRPGARADLPDGVLVRMTFPGSNLVRPQGRGFLPFPSHYFLGRDPAGWRIDVPSFRQVVYPDLYDGIDLIWSVDEDGLKYEYRVLPGADPREIEVAYEGILGLEIGTQGDLVVRTVVGEIFDSPPVGYTVDSVEGPDPGPLVVSEQTDAEAVPCAYELRGPSSFGFSVQGWDGARPLIIDPLLYSTYLGGFKSEIIRSVAVDADGSAYLTGFTTSDDFPITPGAFQTSHAGSWDAFVTKLDIILVGPPPGRGSERIRRSGRIVYSTYIGGAAQDDGVTIKVDSNGIVTIGGHTLSIDFPVTDGSVHAGKWDAYVAKLGNKGRELLYSGFFGGSNDDFGYSMDVDASGAAYLGGTTRSADLPVTPGAFDRTFGFGVLDAYVAKMDTGGGGIVWATYVGGIGIDFGFGIAVDSAGSAYLTGSTVFSPDFPSTPGSFDPTQNGFHEAYVTKLTPDGSGLVYSGFLGGFHFDRGMSITVDAIGSAYVGGFTFSNDFPVTPGAFDTTYGGNFDIFVAKVDPTGSSIGYATYLGGSDKEEPRSLAVNAAGEVLVIGYTRSSDFPVTPGAFDTTYNGNDDAIVTVLSSDGSALVDSTFLGGVGLDRGYGIAWGPSSTIFVGGDTLSPDFPVTPLALKKTLEEKRDAFFSVFGP